MEQPNFWSVTPADVRYSEALSPSAKILYGELSALTNKKGYCHAKNKYFTQLYRCTEKTVQRWLKELKEACFIIIEYSGKERFIQMVHAHPATPTKMSPYPDKNVGVTPTKMSPLYNIKEENITSIIEYLNIKADKKFRIETEAHRRNIRARLGEGFSVEDCKAVIDKKVRKWKGKKFSDGQMGDDFLRPSTLFAPTRFEAYLNESDLRVEKTYSTDSAEVIKERLRKKLNTDEQRTKDTELHQV